MKCPCGSIDFQTYNNQVGESFVVECQHCLHNFCSVSHEDALDTLTVKDLYGLWLHDEPDWAGTDNDPWTVNN